MTKLTFIGTGEAFDPDRVNVSYLLEERGRSIMVDCGYDSSKSLMRYLSKSDQSLAYSPDALLLTHEHGDHTAGISALLMAIWEEANGIVGDNKVGNKRKLDLLSSNGGLLGKIAGDVQRYYYGFWDRFKVEGPVIASREINPLGDELYGFRVKSATTTHGAMNFAYRFDSPEKSFAISGDGSLNEETMRLFDGVDVLIHEGFNVLGSGGKNHASIEQVMDYAISKGIPKVGIVHVNRQERLKKEEIASLIELAESGGVTLFLPEDHQSIEI